jgi:acyl carrier protein
VSDSRERLIRCFTTVFPELDASAISRASLETVDGWDSVATINLLAVVEEEFGITFAPEDLPPLTAFERILEAVEKRRAPA